MRFPLISRTSHEEMVALLQATISEFKEERRVLLDRLSVLGLGGPLFAVEKEVVVQPEAAEESAGQDELQELLAVRRHPARLQQVIRRKLREFGSTGQTPNVAWIPDAAKLARVNAAMEEAEARGRKKG